MKSLVLFRKTALNLTVNRHKRQSLLAVKRFAGLSNFTISADHLGLLDVKQSI